MTFRKNSEMDNYKGIPTISAESSHQKPMEEIHLNDAGSSIIRYPFAKYLNSI